jgi:hypothetical protein
MTQRLVQDFMRGLLGLRAQAAKAGRPGSSIDQECATFGWNTERSVE